MLRLKARVERVDGRGSVELLALANTGFVGSRPEVLLPSKVIDELKLSEVSADPLH